MSEQQQSNLPEINDQDLKKIEFHTKLSLFIAGGFIVIVCLFYFGNFRGGGLSKDGGTWGTFGDYIGGILNPTIAALALYWLVNSIKLQVTELRETNKALKETVETAKKQQNQISLQNFESLFFQLLKAKTDVTNDIVIDVHYIYRNIMTSLSQRYLHFFDDKQIKDWEDKSLAEIIRSKEAIKVNIILFKSGVLKPWGEYYRKNMLDYTSSYFRVCYQIVKLIINNDYLKSFTREDDKVYSLKQKEFFDIFRATLSQYELEAFFFNCLSQYGNYPFKGMMEDYGLLEPLLIDFDRDGEGIHRLTRYAYLYDPKIFEKNKSWILYFEELKNIKLNIELEILEQAFIDIRDIDIILFNPFENMGFINIEEQSIERTSGFNYLFKNKMSFYNLEDIFSHKNVESMKNEYGCKYRENINSIKKLNDNIEIIKSSIEVHKAWFVDNEREIDTEEVVPLNTFSRNDQSISQLLSSIDKKLNEIEMRKKENERFDNTIDLIRNSEYTLTILTLVKYGISYAEYSEFRRNQ